MVKRSVPLLLAGLIVISLAGAAAAQTVCPDSSTCNVTFSQVFTGGWMTGEPYDYVTIVPGGIGETFAGTGIDIQICLKDCSGNPIVGMPAEEIVLFSSSLCICPGGNNADGPTDASGCTTFSGTISGGGTSQGLDVYANGVFICSLPVNVNSPDFADQFISPCFVNDSDRSALLAVMGSTALYDIAYDFDESGPPIDAADLAIFDTYLGASCGGPSPTEAKTWGAIKALLGE